MSRRISIVKAITEKLKDINGVAPYQTNIYGQAFPLLKFWDEVNNFPSLYIVPGIETREYHPGGFAWGFLGVSIKAYCKSQNSQAQLEDLLEDIERVLVNNRTIVFDSDTNQQITDIMITSITTDEGLLDPYAVGEVNLQVRYEALQ